MPGFIEPQLATLKMKAPSGSLWIHEVKYDGYRIQLRIDGDDRRAYTRNGYNWISKFSRIADGFDIEGQAVVDGEVRVGPRRCNRHRRPRALCRQCPCRGWR